MNKYLRIGLALTALTWSNYSPSLAASFPVIRESVIVCDPNAPHNCIVPAADGSIAVTGGGGGGGGGAVTAVSGAYALGSIVDLGTGASPSANTVNARLAAILAAVSTSSNQTSGGQKTQIVDGSGNIIASTSNNLNVQCANCSGSGASATDQASFTAGTSVLAPAGGFFQTTATNNPLTTGQQGMWQFTAQRAGFVNLRNASGVEIGTSATPVQVSIANTAANATAIKVDASATTQPVSGTVAATQSGVWNVTNISGTVSLPTLAATSTKQSDGTQKTQIVDGSGNVIASTSNNLNVQCANCSGSGASATDGATFTAGTSTFAPSGVFYQTTATANALTDGKQGQLQGTAQRAAFVNLRNASGTEIGTSTTPVQVTLANTGANATAVKVDGSASTQPISGTVAATQSGTWTVQPGNTANTTAWKVDGSSVTQPVSGTVSAAQSGTWNITNVSGTVSLPTGAATAAKQPALGTAGSASIDVLTVQGVASMTALKVDGSAVTQPISAASLPLPTGAMGSTGGTVGLVAGSAVIGHVIADSGSTTAVTGTVSSAQSGTWTVQPGNTANTTAWKVDGSSVTQPVSIATAPVLVAGSAIIGKVGIDQTTPGTTNGVQDAATSATGSAVPSKALYNGVVSSGNLTGLIQADTSVAINVSTATTTQLVALSSGKKIYVTALDVIAGGTGNITFEYGTGSNCGTGTTVLTGAYNLTAQTGLAKGSGLAPVLIVPASNALCVLTSAAVQMSGSLAYTQF